MNQEREEKALSATSCEKRKKKKTSTHLKTYMDNNNANGFL
jgi:hypothetical protein